MDIKKDLQVSKLNTQKNVKETLNDIPKKVVYEAEMDMLGQSLKLKSNKIGWRDAQTFYFINKDGSARMTSAWNAVNYPKGTFKDILLSAQEIYLKNGRSFSEDEIKNLIMQFLKQAENFK